MADKDLQFDTRFSNSGGGRGPLAAAIVAGILIVGIIVVSTTDVASRLLPMEERYLDVLVPMAADGSEGLSLVTLTQKEEKTSLMVEGSVMNRSESAISGLSAVIEFKDKYTLPTATVDAPVEPPILEPGATGTFRASATGGQYGLGGYSLQFRLSPDGPFVPHKDERSIDLKPATPTSK
jgi:hypothetical protein